MLEDDLICKIFFFSSEIQNTLWVLGVVGKNQLFSPIHGLIESKNYKNKTLGKADIEGIIFYKVCERLDLIGNELVSKVIFQEAETQVTRWILGAVDKIQLISPISGLIELKNLENKTLGKADIIDMEFYKEYDRVVLDKNSMAILCPISMES